MKILVCGGRDYTNKLRIHEVLSQYKNIPNVSFISGMARGADLLAWKWCKANNIHCEEVPADWKKYSKKAGSIRNQKMLDMDPDLVIAFPGGNGTENMKKITRLKKTPLITIDS
jgi:hypothetical protein